MSDVARTNLFPIARKLGVLGALIAASLAHASPAVAQEVDEFGAINSNQHEARPSEQSVAVEFRFGPYLPKLPNLLNAPQSFGDELGGSHRVLVGIEADWQAIRLPKIFSLGPGAGMAYTRLSRWGTFDNQAYSATLKIMPQWLLAVLRFDMLQQKWDIPLVFSAKLGAARASWWSTNMPAYNNTVTESTSGSAQGLAWALGAMLDLGIVDRARARHLDEISGVNHMYLFWEWYRFKLNDFGNAPDQLGDSTWTLGFAVDM